MKAFMHISLAADPISIQLFFGGLLGGFVRALFGRGKTWEKILILHIFSGAVMAVLLPNGYKYFTGQMLTGPPMFWICAGAFIGLTSNFVLVAILWRAGVFKDDPRPSTYNGG